VVFVVMQAATLFGAAGCIDIVEFWVYVAILAAVSALSLTILDPDLMRERMRPGGRRLGLRFLPLVILMFLHWAVAGLARGRLHLSDTVPPILETVAMAVLALAALDVIGGKWKVFILWTLQSEAQRFGELRRLVEGISEKMLIQHLKEMQADGIVARKDFKEVPPRVEYTLTPFGKSLYAALAPLCEWARRI
jgi:DNA-binding HxlR family transcriptional regulator